MAGHSSGWVKRPGGPSKGRVFVSRAVMQAAGYTPDTLTAAVSSGDLSDADLVRLSEQSEQPRGQAQPAPEPEAPKVAVTPQMTGPQPGVPDWLTDPAKREERRAFLKREMERRDHVIFERGVLRKGSLDRETWRMYRSQLDDIDNPGPAIERYAAAHAKRAADEARKAAQKQRRAAGAKSAEQILAAADVIGTRSRKLTADEQRDLFGANVIGRADIRWMPNRQRFQVTWSTAFGQDYVDVDMSAELFAAVIATGEKLTKETANNIVSRVSRETGIKF